MVFQVVKLETYIWIDSNNSKNKEKLRDQEEDQKRFSYKDNDMVSNF